MRAVMVCGNHRHEICGSNSVSKQIRNRITVPAIQHLAEECGDAIKLDMLFFIDELNLAMISYRLPKVATRQFLPISRLANEGGRTQCEQRVVGNSAEWRTQHCRQRNLVSGIVEETQQLNQISYLFALIKTFALDREIRNPGPTQRAFVDSHARKRAKQNCDLAIGYVTAFDQRFDSFNHLRGIALADV